MFSIRNFLFSIEKDCFEETREILRLASEKSSQFCQEIYQSGLLKAFVSDLENLKESFKTKLDVSTVAIS